MINIKQEIGIGNTGQQLVDKLKNNFDELFASTEFSHTHDNKVALDKLTDVDGKLNYDGSPVAGESSGDYILTSEKGEVDGVAVLDSSKQVKKEQLLDYNTKIEVQTLVSTVDNRLTEVDTQLDTLESQSTAKWVILNRVDNTSTLNATNITNLQTSKVDKIDGYSLSEQNYSLDEKNKLAQLEDSKFAGYFNSLANLNAITGSTGMYAFLDDLTDVTLFIWDSSELVWVKVAGESTAETPASIKTKYESNADTNAFTNAFKSKLESLNNYDDTNLQNQINNKANSIHMHDKTDVGLANVDNTSDLNKPVSTATQFELDLKLNKTEKANIIQSVDEATALTSSTSNINNIYFWV